MKALRAVLSTITAMLTTVGVVAGLSLAQTLPAEAAPKISFTKIHADSPGTDRGGNRSLNAEYVVIRNNTKKAIKIGGYRIKDKQGHRYTVPKGFVLKAKKSVTVRTGKGKNTRSTLYWRSNWYVWNNTSDVAYLYNRNGKRVDSCKVKGVWDRC